MTDSASPQAGIADALAQLSEETRVLVRNELRSAQQEVWEKAKAAAPALALVGGGIALGAAASASAYRFVLRVLERATSPGFGALLATAGFGAGAFVALSAGIDQLRDVELPLPSETVREATGDAAQAAGDAAHHAADRVA